MTHATPDLSTFDALVFSTSGGKDSSAALAEVVDAAETAGVRDRITVVHADLGEAEWPGTVQLAAAHAARYDLPFTVVARRHPNRAVETILERVAGRGRWPDAKRRWCTSDHKRGPIRKEMTRIVTHLRETGKVRGRPARLLNIMGLRAEESAARARRAPLALDTTISSGRREIYNWNPIHDWPTSRVWDRIEQADLDVHPAYADMSRLSCRFCVLARRRDLIAAARLNPEYAAQHAEIESAIGHRFRHALSMEQIIDAANRGDDQTEQGALPPCMRR
ncbi:phosphoadenosine phosphosulfate reductase domain-containing protein [Nocardia carnea]|uniref:phosphoadenosine phosphosulfate reductase domain-containing protein n=1 Tax=Nocardia carnea TaxID=37328 RepID=UPI0002E0C5C1|nr:phosphoadenosine phosphosulfate reductase family protein [Nocardia carnea]